MKIYNFQIGPNMRVGVRLWKPHVYVIHRSFYVTRTLFIGWRGMGYHWSHDDGYSVTRGFGRGDAAPWWKWRFYNIEESW